MRVYRLEYVGWGIWTGGAIGLSWPEDAIYKNEFCTIVKAHSNPDYRFGCSSLDGLIQYFGSDFGKLLAEGCKIVEYKVHKAHVSISHVEVAFKADKVKERHEMTRGKNAAV